MNYFVFSFPHIFILCLDFYVILLCKQELAFIKILRINSYAAANAIFRCCFCYKNPTFVAAAIHICILTQNSMKKTNNLTEKM